MSVVGRIRRVVAWIALAGAPVAAAQAGAPTKTLAKPAVHPNAAHPNVILITIDTLRADHVGCYGAQEVKTPTLDSLAADGVVFDRAI